MRCSCGAEIPAGAVFCGKCGRKVEYDTSRHCSKCGAVLYPGAGFCGKCGAAVTSGPAETAAKCRACGATLHPGARFCGKCRTPVSGDPAAETAVLRSEAGPAGSREAAGTDNRNLAKKILMIALVLGLCLAVVGAAGKIIVGRITGTLQESFFTEFGSESELKMVLGEDPGNEVSKQIIYAIRNDSSAFEDLLIRTYTAAASMTGESIDLSGANGVLIRTMAKATFEEKRNEAIEEIGAYWPLLQLIAYNQELLIIGLIIAVGAAAAWLLLGGKPGDFMELKMMPVLYIGAGWVVLVVVLTIVGLSNLKLDSLFN